MFAVVVTTNFHYWVYVYSALLPGPMSGHQRTQEDEPSIFGSDLESLPGDEAGLEGLRMLLTIVEVDGGIYECF